MLSGGFPLAKHCHTSCPPTLTDKHHCTLPCSVTHPAPDKKAHISPDIQLYLDTDFPSWSLDGIPCALLPAPVPV
jgi:hypothetical protein